MNCLYYEDDNKKAKAGTNKKFKGISICQKQIANSNTELVDLRTFVIDLSFSRESPISPIGFLERTVAEPQNQDI